MHILIKNTLICYNLNLSHYHLNLFIITIVLYKFDQILKFCKKKTNYKWLNQCIIVVSLE